MPEAMKVAHFSVVLLLACSANEAGPSGPEPGGATSSAGGSATGGVGGVPVASGGNAAVAGTVSVGAAGAATAGAAGLGGSAGAAEGGIDSGGGGGSAGLGAGGAAGQAGASGAAGSAASLCPASAQLCLDFESGDYAGWNKKESGGTITVDETRARHGKRALLIATPANQRGGLIENHGAPLFPLPDKKMWGRVMVYFEGVPDGHTDLIRGSGANGAGPNYNVGEQHDSVMLNYYAGSRATDCWARPKPEKKVPDKTWMCWEWSFDSANNRMEYWLDGALLRSVDKTGDGCLEGNGVWQAPSSFESVSVGEQIAELSPNTAFKLWLDDVAVSHTARVGCPAE